MNQTLIEIGIRRGRLIERIATQRAGLCHDLKPVCQALKRTDRAVAAVRTAGVWLKKNPGVTATTLAVLLVLKPRRVWRWARRSFVAWRSWQALRGQLRAFASRPL